jgi:RNA polymerase sigma factor (TIGR02999 family)
MSEEFAPDDGDITGILMRIREGESGAFEELIGRVYKMLRRLAAAQMRRERPDHTLQPTVLVHEVYMRLMNSKPLQVENRSHLFATAVQLMRRMLIDHARAKHAEKRGGAPVTLTLDEAQIVSLHSADELLAVHEALDRLAVLAPRQAQIVELRFFGGLSIDEIATLLDIVPRTVDRDWRAARVWLRRELGRQGMKPE